MFETKKIERLKKTVKRQTEEISYLKSEISRLQKECDDKTAKLDILKDYPTIWQEELNSLRETKKECDKLLRELKLDFSQIKKDYKRTKKSVKE